MKLSIDQIKKLKEETGLGLNDCQKVLKEADGDLNKALAILKRKGSLVAAEKMGRQACEGLVACYLHHDEKIGAMVQVNCETDFVARTPDFKELVHDLAMQVAATNPQYIKADDIPKDVLKEVEADEKKLLKKEGKPANLVEKIVAGKMKKYYEKTCLLNQPFIKDEELTVEELINQKVVKLGEKISLERFTRFNL